MANKSNKAEYVASGAATDICDIIKKEGKVYFKLKKYAYTKTPPAILFEYEIEYDEFTKILTVYYSTDGTKHFISSN